MLERIHCMTAAITTRLGAAVAAAAIFAVAVGAVLLLTDAVMDERGRLEREIDRTAADRLSPAVQAALNTGGAHLDDALRGVVAHPLITAVDLDVPGFERAVASPKPTHAVGWALALTLTPPTMTREVVLNLNGRSLGAVYIRYDAGEAATQAVERLKRSLAGGLPLVAVAALTLYLTLRRTVAASFDRLADRMDLLTADVVSADGIRATETGTETGKGGVVGRLEKAFEIIQNRFSACRRELDALNRRINAAVAGAESVAFETDVDEDGRLVRTVWTTTNIGSFLGYPPGVGLPRDPWRRALHPEDAGRVLESERRHMLSGSTEPFRCLYRLVTYDNRVITVETTAIGQYDSAGKPLRLSGVNRNVTARYEAERRIDELLHTDELTGLGNRAALERAVAVAIDDGKRLDRQTAALHLNLDRFKPVNETYGHSVADGVLRCIAQRWVKLLPEGAAMYRLGGDEFVVVAPTPTAAAAGIRLAEKLAAATDEPLPDHLPPITLTASAGVAVLPLDGETADDALSALRHALQSAKQAGGACVRLHQARQSESAKNRIQMERDLAGALARNELTLHYQPRVAADGRIVGAEALARWITPQRTIPPGVFIPVAEETGLIAPLGLWALRAACRQAKQWLVQYGPAAPKVAVNVSARQLMASHFEADVANALREAGVPPEMIELELTESAALGRIDDARRKVAALRELGVGMAVDDFGTGYSALSYIANLPFSSVKIDQSFTRDLPDSPAARAVVTAALQIARDLDMTVVAEGVETAQQAEYLIRSGAHELQGYHYARPLPADRLAAQWLDAEGLDAGGPDERGLDGNVISLRRIEAAQ